MSDDNSKIIVDEDWKAQVEREREEARKKAEAGDASQDAGDEPQAPAQASFESLVSFLGMQGMMALGMMAARDAKEVVVDIEEAKYLIDTLMILRDKTKGNLTPQEQGALTETLAGLQQVYVLRSQQLQESALQGLNPAGSRG